MQQCRCFIEAVQNYTQSIKMKGIPVFFKKKKMSRMIMQLKAKKKKENTIKSRFTLCVTSLSTYSWFMCTTASSVV